MTVLDKLTAALGADKVLTDQTLLQSRRHDYWFLSALNDFQGRSAPNPLCVVPFPAGFLLGKQEKPYDSGSDS